MNIVPNINIFLGLIFRQALNCNNRRLSCVLTMRIMKIRTAKYNLLLKNYKHKIYSYCYFMLRNKMDAEDVSQEVFIKIWSHLDDFNVLAANGWIMKTAHNACLDQLRKRSRELNRSVSIDDEFAENFMSAESDTNPAETASARELEKKLEAAVLNLPEKLKSVFVLRQVHDMKYKDIAKTLGITIDDVKVTLLRARKKLQEELERDGTVKAY